MNISIEEMPRELERLLEENEKLQEDLDYSNYCNEELRKKISNLNYKIKLLEEDDNDVNVANTIIFDLQDRIDKAIEELELWKQKNKVIKTEIDCLLDILKGSE